MKLLKTANKNQKLVISKKEWQDIGKKAGWSRVAMPVPMPNEEERRLMQEEGYAAVPHVPRAKHVKETLPNTGKRDLKDVMQGYDIEGLDPQTILELPSIAKFDPSMMVEIQGKNYYVVHLIPATKKIPGEIIAIEVESGELIHFPLEETEGAIRTPREIKQTTVDTVNKEIALYNKKIEETGKYTGVSRINLQIASNEAKVDERLSTIDQMVSVYEERKNSSSPSKGYEQWMERLMKEMEEGKISKVDVFHTIIFKYQKRPQQLIDDLNNNMLPVPEDLKAPLLGVAQRELENKRIKEEKDQQNAIERKDRIDESWDDFEGVEENPIQPIDESSIPGGQYTRLPSYADMDSTQQQNYQVIKSLMDNKSELEMVKRALSNLRMYVADLEKGARSDKALRSEEGKAVIENISLNLNDIKRFVKKYKIDLIDDGKLNSKLMGTSGRAIGNAIMAVSLSGLINTIYNTIEPLTERGFESVKEPVSPVPEEVGEENPVLSHNISTLGIHGMSFELADRLKKQLKKAQSRQSFENNGDDGTNDGAGLGSSVDAKIIKSKDTNEYVVKVYINDKHKESLDYYTDDLEDAKITKNNILDSYKRDAGYYIK